ncbi:hypothetical protein LSAT2_026893, partial [Lamellibrachia satsuma]
QAPGLVRRHDVEVHILQNEITSQQKREEHQRFKAMTKKKIRRTKNKWKRKPRRLKALLTNTTCDASSKRRRLSKDRAQMATPLFGHKTGIFLKVALSFSNDGRITFSSSSAVNLW